MFFIGIDAGGTQIFTTSPSGIYRSFKAYAIGTGEASAREYLTEHYKEELPFEEIINLALNALKNSIDEEATKENIRMAYIKGETKKFHMCSKNEIGQYLDLIK